MDLTQHELDQLRTAMNAELDRLIAARKHEVKQWPQVGSTLFAITSSGDVVKYEVGASMPGDVLDEFTSIGNVFKTRAEAERRVEALKVQAELRRMPGVVTPVFNHSDYFAIISRQTIGEHGEQCHAIWIDKTGHVCLAVAGVWFETKQHADDALYKIGRPRIELWIDDYLQTPIE